MQEKLQKIRGILSDQFEIELFEASINCLNDTTNKIRYNNFAYSMRELSRHFLTRLAPDYNILACSWYHVVPGTNRPTREQQIKYSIQGGFENEQLESLGIEMESFSRSTREIVKSISSLSKYTHINPDIFNLSAFEVDKKTLEVLKSFETFVIAIEDCRSRLISCLESKLEHEALNAVVTSSFENIDSLAPHYSLEDVYIDNYYVEEITDQEIVVIVEGEIEVALSWGSNSERRNGDGHDVEDGFPFTTRIIYPIDEYFTSDNPEVDDPVVDTSRYDIDPDNEILYE